MLSNPEQLRQTNQPSPERLQHADIAPVQKTIPDVDGAVSMPVGRVRDCIASLYANGSIGEEHYKTALEFQALFAKRFSQACDPGRIPGTGGDPEAGLVKAIDRNTQAAEALNLLPEYLQTIAIEMIGHGMTLREYALKSGYDRRRLKRDAVAICRIWVNEGWGG